MACRSFLDHSPEQPIKLRPALIREAGQFFGRWVSSPKESSRTRISESVSPLVHHIHAEVLRFPENLHDESTSRLIVRTIFDSVASDAATAVACLPKIQTITSAVTTHHSEA
jgi:hypothetical protein